MTQTKKSPVITRSTGIVPGVPWFGPLPGGGYQGITKHLDNAVQKAAKWFNNRGHNVEIRFNSDRLSGGAYIKPDVTDNHIGINAIIKTKTDFRTSLDFTEKTPVSFAVNISGKYLKNKNDIDVNNRADPDSCYGYWFAKDFKDAISILRAKLDDESKEKLGLRITQSKKA